MKSLLVLFALVVLATAQQNFVNVFAFNSFEVGCQFPRYFLKYQVTSTAFTDFWDTSATYDPTSNQLLFKCLDVFGCDPREWAFAYIIPSINLTTYGANCVMAYQDLFYDDGDCYTEWICGNNWKPPTPPSLTTLDTAEIMKDNYQQYITKKAMKA